MRTSRFIHGSRDHRGATCWDWSRRPCLHCAWRTITGKNRAARKRWLEMTRRIRECPHNNTRPNPEATAVLDHNPRVCLDCGTGIVSVKVKR